MSSLGHVFLFFFCSFLLLFQKNFSEIKTKKIRKKYFQFFKKQNFFQCEKIKKKKKNQNSLFFSTTEKKKKILCARFQHHKKQKTFKKLREDLVPFFSTRPINLRNVEILNQKVILNYFFLLFFAFY